MPFSPVRLCAHQGQICSGLSGKKMLKTTRGEAQNKNYNKLYIFYFHGLLVQNASLPALYETESDHLRQHNEIMITHMR